MSHNRFGATAAQVVALYAQTAAEDYGGESVIGAALDRATDALLGWMTEEVYMAITAPALLYLVQRATEGQTAVHAPFVPIAGDLVVWTGQPSAFQAKPRLSTDRYASDMGLMPLEDDAYAIDAETGGIDLDEALDALDIVCATFTADTEGAAYSVPSLARLAVRGAGAELGAMLYTQESQAWALVEAYRTEFMTALDDLKQGNFVPAEVRRAIWWQEVTRAQSGKAGTVNLWRG